MDNITENESSSSYEYAGLLSEIYERQSRRYSKEIDIYEELNR